MHSEIKRLIYIPLLSRTCFEVVFQDPLQTAENPTTLSRRAARVPRCGPRSVRRAAASLASQIRGSSNKTETRRSAPGKDGRTGLLQRNDLRSRGSSSRQNRPPGLSSLSQEQQEARGLILPYQGLGKGDKWRIYGQTEMSQIWAAQDSSC